MKKSPVVLVVAIGIGAALFFVLGRFVTVPSPVPNTTINIQYGLLAFMACLYGPIAGLFIGLIGHALIDFSFGWGIWWSWVIASGACGLILGLVSKKTAIGREQFGPKSIARLIIYTIIANVIAWIGVAPILDILIYAEPANKVFAQGAVACISNAITACIIGVLLCLAYAKIKPKSGSLKKGK